MYLPALARLYITHTRMPRLYVVYVVYVHTRERAGWAHSRGEQAPAPRYTMRGYTNKRRCVLGTLHYYIETRLRYAKRFDGERYDIWKIHAFVIIARETHRKAISRNLRATTFALLCMTNIKEIPILGLHHILLCHSTKLALSTNILVWMLNK